MNADQINKQLKKVADIISNTTTICAFIATIATFILVYYDFATILIYIPLWIFILSVSFPFACWWLVRHRLSIKKRKFKTGEIVKVLGDSRPFIVFTYYTWHPSYLKLKEKDGDCIIDVNQKYVSEYKDYEDDSTRFSFLPPSVRSPKIKNKDIPIVAAKITKL